jgi:hypothetical protein
MWRDGQVKRGVWGGGESGHNIQMGYVGYYPSLVRGGWVAWGAGRTMGSDAIYYASFDRVVRDFLHVQSNLFLAKKRKELARGRRPR